MRDRPGICLDVETDWDPRLTLLGFWSEATGLVQFVGADITAARLREALPPGELLYTYNGHCFDLPVIRDQLGLDLRTTHTSHDLRRVCQRHGLRGGQKAVERRIGVARALAGLDGRDAVALWSRHLRGDRAALETRLYYNREDLDGLVEIRDHLHEPGFLRA